MSITITNATSTVHTQVLANREIKYIVIHYTAGVTSKSGSAANTANYYKTTDRDVSADYTVDDAGAVLYNPDIKNRYCWHCGGTKYSNKGGKFYKICTNANSIGIEVCSTNSTGKIQDGNSSTYSFTTKVVDNAVELTKQLMKTYGIDADHVIRHYDVTGKLCPGIKGWNAESGSEIAWNSFKNRISGTSATADATTTSATTTTTAASTSILYRVRKTWADSSSQLGAYSSLENAKAVCKSGYSVFDSNGNIVYTADSTTTATTAVSTPDVYYRVYNGAWLSEIKNYNTTNSSGYAGKENTNIQGFTAKSSKGTLKYRVHLKNGNWLGWISGYNINDWNNGVAGIKGKNIDGVQLDLTGVTGYTVKYRVSVNGSSSYLPWVTGWNTSSNGYAGSFGKIIDKVQVEIIKK